MKSAAQKTGKVQAVSYKKLWKLLIDKDMNKTDLCRETGIANSTIAKMTRGDDVLVSVLTRICNVLDCEIGDIVGLEEQKRTLSLMRF